MIVQRSSFSFLFCWDYHIYIAILLSITAIASVFAIKKRSFFEFVHYFWNYYSLPQLYGSYLNRGKNDFLDNFFTILWLISNTVILTLFSSKLYDIIVSQPIFDKIESIDQLLTKNHWIDSEIYYLDQNIYDLILRSTENKNTKTNKLFERSQFADPSKLSLDNVYRKQIVEKVFDDNAVIVSNRLLAHFIMRSVLNDWPLTMSHYVRGIHFDFSEPADEYNCYYLYTHYEILGQTMLDKFNKM